VMNGPCWSRASLTAREALERKFRKEFSGTSRTEGRLKILVQGDLSGDGQIEFLARNTLEEATSRPARKRRFGPVTS